MAALRRWAPWIALLVVQSTLLSVGGSTTTPTPSATPSNTPTRTRTATQTTTSSRTSTESSTLTRSHTETTIPTTTPTLTLTPTPIPTPTPAATSTASKTPTRSYQGKTYTPTLSITRSNSATPNKRTGTATPTSTLSSSLSLTQTSESTRSPTRTRSFTPTLTGLISSEPFDITFQQLLPEIRVTHSKFNTANTATFSSAAWRKVLAKATGLTEEQCRVLKVIQDGDKLKVTSQLQGLSATQDSVANTLCGLHNSINGGELSDEIAAAGVGRITETDIPCASQAVDDEDDDEHTWVFWVTGLIWGFCALCCLGALLLLANQMWKREQRLVNPPIPLNTVQPHQPAPAPTPTPVDVYRIVEDDPGMTAVPPPTDHVNVNSYDEYRGVPEVVNEKEHLYG